MSGGDIIALVIIAAFALLAVILSIKRRKNCDGNCENCKNCNKK